jgi:tryptophan synthase alpha chain
VSSSPTRAGALADRLRQDGTTVVPYLTGGFPSMAGFAGALTALAADSVAIEIGIPFSDPMADGLTIQESSRAALEEGATLGSILAQIESVGSIDADLVVMSYLNPLLAYGPDRLLPRLASAGVAALVVPDLPLEESGHMSGTAAESGIGLVQLVSPVTTPARAAVLGAKSSGFTYAVTMTGTTGGTVGIGDELIAYLEMVRANSAAPVLAGFGVRSREQVGALAPYCDGVIVGSALVEVLAAGEDPVAFVEGLTP